MHLMEERSEGAAGRQTRMPKQSKPAPTFKHSPDPSIPPHNLSKPHRSGT